MLLIKSHIKAEGPSLLINGDHAVRIESAAESFAKDRSFNDRTPQIAIRFKNSKGYITHWINTKGYMTIEDYPLNVDIDGIIFKEHPFSKIMYAVDVFTGCRIENHNKTTQCMFILGRIGHCVGIDEDVNFTLADLVGLEMGIRVLNQKVIKTFRKI